MILKKIFTDRQLSLFFQFAILINIVGLLSNIIVYRYFPNSIPMKFTNQNLSNLSILIISAILIPKTIFGFFKKHKKKIQQYKFTGVTIMITLSVFLFWILKMDNFIQEKFIIFFSNLSRIDHSTTNLSIVIVIFCLLIFSFYKNISTPEKINHENVLIIIYDTFRLLLTEYILIFLTVFTVLNIKQLNYFQSKILDYSLSSITNNITFIKIIIPISWFFMISYYVLNYFFRKKQ